MAGVETKGVSASTSLAKIGGQQFGSVAEAEAHALQLARAAGAEAVVVKDEHDRFWVVKATDLAKLTAATSGQVLSTDPKTALAPGKASGVRGFQVVKTARPTEAVDAAPSVRAAAVATGEKLLSSYARQSELFLNAVYADKYVDWIDTFGNTQRLRPHDAATVMLRLNASVWSVVRDLRNGSLTPADVGLGKGETWESAKENVSARAIYDLAIKRLHADALDYGKVIPEMQKDPVWVKQPIVINDPEKGTYALTPDQISWLKKSEYVFFAPNEAAEYVETLPIARDIRDQAVAEAEATPERAASLADGNLVHVAFALSRGKGIAANNTQATLAMSVAAQVPLVVPELAEPGATVNDLKAKQRTGELAGFEESNGTYIVFRPKTVETIAREVRAKVDAGELAHLGPEALRELGELTGPASAPGKELAARLEKEGRSRFWRSTTGEIVDMALIGLASGGVASVAEGVAVGLRAAPGVIKAAHFLANSATFTTLSGLSHGQISAERYAIDAGMFVVLGQAGRFAALAGKVVPGNTATLRFLQSAAAQTATVGTSAVLLTGFGALEAAAKDNPLSTKEVWQQLGHNLLVVGTLHSVNTAIARLTPQLAPGAQVHAEVKRLRQRAETANQSLAASLDELSLVLVEASKTAAASPKQTQLSQRAEQILSRIDVQRRAVEDLHADVVHFANRSLPAAQRDAFLRDLDLAAVSLGLRPLSNDQLLFCLNKTPQRVAEDFSRRLRLYDVVIGTKATREQYLALKSDPALAGGRVSFDEVSRVLTVERGKPVRRGLVVIAAAGAGDVPVAEEAARIAEAMGNRVERIYDFALVNGAPTTRAKQLLRGAGAVIAVSGGRAELPNEIASLTDKPVLALPTTGRFGEGLSGVESLMTAMKNWGPGVAVVNSDNGFGAAYVADKINRQLIGAVGAQPGKAASTAKGAVVVTTAGSADIPVAERAARELEKLGETVVRLYDRGVNDPKNVTDGQQAFADAKAIVVAAGLEGGLPNAVAAVTQRPVIAVPTSVGYGTGKGGVASLMSALNACSPGISVVSIDDGVAAATVAHKLSQLR